MNGYYQLDVLKMYDEEYDYLNGGFDLYTINSTILSIILAYSEVDIPKFEILFGLQDADEIPIPYNKYIDQLGSLRTIELT